VAISAEDAKTIAENIKIIQDWQKDPANQDALTSDLKNRIANVLKGVATLGVPTQSSTPTTTSSPAAAPADSPADPKSTQINQILNSMDQLLKKNKYESVINKNSPPLTEAEQMARLRSIVTEDVSDWLPDWDTIGKVGAGAYLAKKFGKSSAPAAPAAPAPNPAATSAIKSAWLKAVKVLKTGGKVGLLVGSGILAKGIYDWAMADPTAAKTAGIDAQDLEEFKRLNDQLSQIVKTQQEIDALPPDVKQKITDTNQRILKMAAAIANQKALEP
jgi:hypothetical protein